MKKSKEKLKNQYLIEYLCTKAIIEKINVKGSTIAINEISYRVLALYWQVKINENNSEIVHNALKEIQYDLISKYGLAIQSNVSEIEQILNYINDKSIQIKLFGIIKPYLTLLSDPNKNNEINNYIINKLNELDIDKTEFFKVNKNISIKISPKWGAYLKGNHTFINEIEKRITELENGNFKEEIKYEKEDKEQDYSSLFELEKKMRFHMKLNKKEYTCLEEALEWMDMDADKYRKIHNLYIKHIEDFGFKNINLKLPLVISAMLLYTAIYRYNDEDANGFWPEFFGSKDAYNYARDVPPAMECLSYMIKNYEIDTDKRKYLQKKNLADIFSQIYLPEISLIKILSAIYSYYFKGSFVNKLINKVDFIEKNEYCLDKPGIFLISEDKVNEDIFYDLVELVRYGLKGIESTNERIPIRFYTTLEKWLKEDKEKIDKTKDEYYIANPKILLDVINNEIKINLPKQKSRDYSDEEIIWNIIVDETKSKVQCRVIRQKDGSYLILEERFKINSFKNIIVEYIFNDKKLGTWEFKNNKEYLIFDGYGTLLNKDNINRDGCFLALPKNAKLEVQGELDRFQISGWKNHIFYYLELAEYQEEKLMINEEINIKIDEKPVVKRKGFESLFEDPNVKSLNENINIYKKTGSYEIISPFIKTDDIQIIFDNIEEKRCKVDLIEINIINKKIIELKFNKELISGIYSIIIKYKNKNIYRESFIVDKSSILKKDYEISYSEEENKSKIVRIYNDSGIEIQQYDYKTKVKRRNSEYIIETEKASVSRFIYKIGDSEVLIRQIVKPIKLELTGLEEVIEATGRNKVKQITKEVLNSKNINLYIKNLDYKYKYLKYELIFMDNISDNSVISSKNIEFEDEYDWDFKELQDRIVDFKDINVKLKISDNQGNIIYDKVLLRIKEYIDIYNFQVVKTYEDKLLLKWDENQSNNHRQITFHNITNPNDKELKFDLEDGVTEFELDSNTMKYGAYIPLIEFKKRGSLFNSIESNIDFFERSDIRNTFTIENDNKINTGHKILSKLIWFTYKEEYENLDFIMNSLDIAEVELYTVLCTIIQMKYFTKNTKESKQALLDSTNHIIELLLRKYSKNELVRYIVELKSELLRKDLSYILTSLLAFEKAYRLDGQATDILLDFNLINALLSLENGKNKLSNQMKRESKEQFDYELLSPDTIHNHDKIFDIISNEMKIIIGFWNWITNYKNSHLLKYDYSKARLFRMYVEENEISTYKILGRTLDDMVDNMVAEDKSINPQLPNKWSIDMNVEEDIYGKFLQLINENIQVNYINLLKAAFISVTRFSLYSDKDYFDLIMKCELSNQKDIFNRYRAYFKLIFI